MVVEFPLRGEWVAYHTPEERIPSHGTDQLGQRFAYDFLRIERDKPGWKFCRASMARYHAFGVPLRVRSRGEVAVGEHLADVGHSGNSTAPHLHFQLMDGARLLEAAGLPCAFRGYEAFRDEAWSRADGGIPGKREFIRYAA